VAGAGQTGFCPITNYRIYRGTASGAETLLTTEGQVLSYRDQKTTSRTRYYYVVTALSSAGEGALSNGASAVAK
jgi:fibronectin type 3 domain-containing protein